MNSINKPKRGWLLSGETVKEPYHYKGCGLDDIYLLSGYERKVTAHGTSVTIKNLDGLLRAIGDTLVARKKILDGKEIRFLRHQMDITQSELARLFGCDAQQVARYEKGQSKIPGPADRVLRMLYIDHMGGKLDVRELLDKLDSMDARINDRQVFAETPDGWHRLAA
jgi:DNA-binding transcriptional regulator YiaG